MGRNVPTNRGLPSGVLEAVSGGVVEDLAEPGVRVEREHVHVRVVLGEGLGVGGERGVVLGDVLLVEGRACVAVPGRGAINGRNVDEEVCAAEVVVVGLLLLMEAGYCQRKNLRRLVRTWNIPRPRRETPSRGSRKAWSPPGGEICQNNLTRAWVQDGERTCSGVGDSIASVINADPPRNQRLVGRVRDDVGGIRCPLIDLVCEIDGEGVVQ